MGWEQPTYLAPPLLYRRASTPDSHPIAGITSFARFSFTLTASVTAPFDAWRFRSVIALEERGVPGARSFNQGAPRAVNHTTRGGAARKIRFTECANHDDRTRAHDDARPRLREKAPPSPAGLPL
jgi:hypothetical protein